MTPPTQFPGPPALPFRRPRLTRAVVSALWWGTLAFTVMLSWSYVEGDAGGPLLRVLSVYVQYVPVTALSGLAMLLAASHGNLLPTTRRALRWIAAGLLGMLVGMALYIWAHHFSGAAYGSPLLGDIAYLTSYTALLVGLLTLPRRAPAEYEGWKVVLDASVLLVGVGLLGWYFIIRPTTVSVTDPLDLFIRIAYPALDLAFLFAINRILIAGGPADGLRGFRWLAAAVLAYVTAESFYQVLYYGPDSPSSLLELLSEVMFAVAYVLFFGAAIRYATGGRVRRRTPAALPMSPLSLLATGSVAAVLSVVAVRNWTMPLSPLILGSVGLTMLVLLRQGLTVAQNAALLKLKAQREGDARVAALVRHASDLIMVASADGRLRFVSPSAERILGVHPSRLVGRRLVELVHAEDIDACHQLLAEDASSSTVAVRLASSDDRWREFEVVSTDLTSEAAVEGIVLVARDLTERNALEARLRQSQKMEAVGRLAGGVAHDFNNLLTTILVSTDLVLERSLDTATREDLDVVRQAAERAAGLTGQLLAFSRQDVRQRRPVDLRVLVDDTVKLLRRLLGQDVIVDVVAGEGDLHVEGDANQLAQVIVNLALNARDAMPRGGAVGIDIRRLSTPDRDQVTLAIRDSGSGMDTVTQGRMFEPFFTTKAAGQGTGLGLATTARIIEQHGGTIAVESAPTLGTSVTMTLPVAPPRLTPDSDSPPPYEDGPPVGTEFVLLVEDEPPVRDVTARILTRLGYQVVSCGSGAEALALLEQRDHAPDLLLTDVMMPGMTGPELAAIATVRHADLRVLFISGYPGDELRHLGIRGDEVPFLQKPFTPRELADRVRESIDLAAPLPGSG